MSKTKKPDLNDQLLSGFTIEEMVATSTPMEVDKLVVHTRDADAGLKYLQGIVDEVKGIDPDEDQAVKKELRIKILLDTESHYTELAWAWIINKKELQPLLFEIRPHHGLARPVDKLLAGIKRTAKKIEKKLKAEALVEATKRIPTRGVVHAETYDMLVKKAVTVDGSFSHWGPVLPRKLNMERILRFDPNWAGRIKHCSFDGRTHLMSMKNDEMVGEKMTDALEAKIGSWVADVYGFELNDKQTGQILHMIASDDEYHPVEQYLRNLRWDGTPRLNGWITEIMESPDHKDRNYIIDSRTGELVDYSRFGLKHATLPQIYGIRWMLSAVARAFKPGCKVDTILIFVNPKQGSFKSEICKLIATKEEWGTKSNFDVINKESKQIIQGKWIAEFQECTALHRRGHNAAKSFLSTEIDRFRTPYDRHPLDVPRTCVFIGTTNQTRLGFLNDVTGHRRYWVCRVGRAKINQFQEDLDQLWAEATWHYLRGENWWLTDNEDAVREINNDRFREVDSWEEEICQILLAKMTRDITDLISKIDKKYGVDHRNFYIVDDEKREIAREENWKDLDSDIRKKFVVSKVSFTLKSIMHELQIPIKDQRQAELNRMADIMQRIGVKREGRRRVGKAYARTWWMDQNHFKDLLFEYGYHLVEDILDAPLGESEEAKQKRLERKKKNPLLAYCDLLI